MVFDLRSRLWQYLPSPVISVLRRARQIFRRRNYYKGRVFDSTGGLTRSDLEGALRQIGLVEGDVVLVHSALSRIGLIQGGANTVIEALLSVIAPSGTLMMPTFTVKESMLAQARSGEIFNVGHTPSQTGRLTEVFRQYPHVVRSVHPTHSMAALGDDAVWLTGDHHHCTTPFGPGSPFARLIEKRGQILCVGIEIAYITSYHAFEDRTPDFPEQVYLPEVFALPVVDSAGRQFDVGTRVHDPQVSLRRLEKRPEVLARVQKYLTETGRLTTVGVGKGAIYRIGADDLNEALGEMLKQGDTIYMREEEV